MPPGNLLENTVPCSFLNFLLASVKDMEKIYSCSTSGSHSDSFSNDQNLTLNWFQTSGRRNRLFPHSTAAITPQSGSD
jgi:hypothetical protein